MWLGQPFDSWSVEGQQKLVPARFQGAYFLPGFRG